MHASLGCYHKYICLFGIGRVKTIDATIQEIFRIRLFNKIIFDLNVVFKKYAYDQITFSL